MSPRIMNRNLGSQVPQRKCSMTIKKITFQPAKLVTDKVYGTHY